MESLQKYFLKIQLVSSSSNKKRKSLIVNEKLANFYEKIIKIKTKTITLF